MIATMLYNWAGSAVGIFLLLLVMAGSVVQAEETEKPLVWQDASKFTVEGRGWTDTLDFYNRFPAAAKDKVREGLWALSRDSAGMVIRFVTDSPELHVRWKLISSTLAMYHMPSTGMSGVDLYIKRNGKWHWMAIGVPSKVDNEAKMLTANGPGKFEYALYLPLYNGVSSVELGVCENSIIEPAPPRSKNIKPVVFYGTSITQGGCASRPGLAYPALIGRALDIPTINLGFSGSGRCEAEVADLLTELDPSVYVIDCLPNMEITTIDERIRYLLKVLKEKHPSTPVILVEDAPRQFEAGLTGAKPKQTPKGEVLEKIYKDLADKWKGKLFYIKGTNLVGEDGEGTVDSVHCNDLGFYRMTQIMVPVLKKALPK